MRRSLAAILTGMILLALGATPALGQDPYPPAPTPTCELVVVDLNLLGLTLNFRGEFWEPNSTVDINVLLLQLWQANTDGNGSFELFVLNLAAVILDPLAIIGECEGTDAAGNPATVPLQLVLVTNSANNTSNVLSAFDPPAPSGGTTTGLLGTLLRTVNINTTGPAPWTTYSTTQHLMVLMLAGGLLAVGVVDVAVWRRFHRKR